MKFCDEPGCGAIVARARCPAHARAVERARGSRQARGYGNRWARRAALFRVRYPLCGMRPGDQAPVMSKCFDEHRVTLGEQVDHVVPHRGNDALFWDELGNWQTLCRACHTRKSGAGL
jgi:5-methylcytosine-specific restriction protein A